MDQALGIRDKALGVICWKIKIVDIRNFRELEIWRRSFDLVARVYRITEAFPDTEKFGLTAQIRRCAVSIPSNIAEGCGYKSDKGFGRYLNIALGSSFELETQLLLSRQLNFGVGSALDECLDELKQVHEE